MTALSLLLASSLLLPQTAPPAEEGSPDALVARIRENLLLIDQQLLDASAVDDVATGLAGVRVLQVDVVRDLEELIKQMKYQRSSSSSSGGGDSSQRQSSSTPRPSDGESRQAQGGEQPQSPQERQAQAQPSEKDAQGEAPRPKEGAANRQPPQQQDAGTPPPDPLGDFTRKDTDDRWGLLPPKLQERLLNLHVDDVPERYRAWLEAYIRSVRRLESKGSP